MADAASAATPTIQDLSDSQAFNRYSYVRNNPLSLVDPDGFSWLSSIFHAIGHFFSSVFKAIVGMLQNPRALLSLAASIALFLALGPEGLAINTYLAAGISGGVAGFISTGTLKGALIGAATAMAFAGVGDLKAAWKINTNTFEGAVESAGMHGVVGGASSVASGGKFGSGFLAAGFSDLASPYVKGDMAERTLETAFVGGVASVLGGGKFENGFVTAAMGYLFNQCAHDKCWTPKEEQILVRQRDILAYYKRACQGGDSYTCSAYHIAADDNLAGHVANARLRYALWAQGIEPTEEVMNEIRQKMATSYSNYLAQTEANAFQPVDMDIANIHWSVFLEYGLSPSTFGGTPLGAGWAMTFGVTGAKSFWPGWCTKCATYQP